MNEYVHPEFLKAHDHYQAMVKQYGDDHPITQQAFTLVLHYAPEHIKKEMDAKAKELGLLPPVGGYTDDGEPMYSLEAIAKHFGMKVEDAEQTLLQVMESRRKAGLPNDALFIDPNTNFNRVQ